MFGDKISACIGLVTVIYEQNKQHLLQVLRAQVSGKTKSEEPSLWFKVLPQSVRLGRVLKDACRGKVFESLVRADGFLFCCAHFN